MHNERGRQKKMYCALLPRAQKIILISINFWFNNINLTHWENIWDLCDALVSTRITREMLFGRMAQLLRNVTTFLSHKIIIGQDVNAYQNLNLGIDDAYIELFFKIMNCFFQNYALFTKQYCAAKQNDDAKKT